MHQALRTSLAGALVVLALVAGSAQAQDTCTNTQSVVCKYPAPVKIKANAGSTVCRADVRSVQMQKNCQVVFKQLAEEGRAPKQLLSWFDIATRTLAALAALALLAYVGFVVLMLRL